MLYYLPRFLSEHRDVALVIVGALLISMKGIIAKLLYAQGVTVEAALLLRAWIALPLIWAWALYRIGPRMIVALQPNLIAGALTAGVACYYFGSWLDFVALSMIDASLERVLLFSYPMLVVIARALMRRAWPERRVIVAVLMTYVGIIFAVGGFERQLWVENAFGAALVMGSACSFAYYMLANERVALAAGSVVFIVYASSSAALALVMHFVIFGQAADLVITPRAWGLLVFMTTATNVLPLFLISASIRRIGAQRASIISSIGPPATIVLAMVYLGESMHVTQVLGAALIIGGILVLEVRRSHAALT
jgi:drug/metabolite transporter (DMT)-like permease